MFNPNDDLILIAKVRKAHGVKGEIALETFTMDDRRFRKLKEVRLRDIKGEVTVHKVVSARVTANGVLMKLEGVDDRDQADALRNMHVVIPESERAPLPEGQAYYDQIIGMTVVDDETEAELGNVLDILEMPAGEVFILEIGGKEHLLSNAGEEVRKIDVKAKQLRVKLLEEYGANEKGDDRRLPDPQT